MSEPTELKKSMISAISEMFDEIEKLANANDELRAENERLTASPLPDEVTDVLERTARDAKMVRECNASLGKRIAELEAENKRLADENFRLSLIAPRPSDETGF